MKYFIIFLFLLTGPLCSPTAAQKPPDFGSPDIYPGARYDFLGLARYNQMAAQVPSMPLDFRFGAFRTLYTLTKYYDPAPEDAQRQMLRWAEDIKKDGNKAGAALQDYKILLGRNLANFDVVTLALQLAERDARLGDPKFLQWLYDGLLANILVSGDGYNLDGAYDAITRGEEAELLRRLDLRILSARTVNQGIVTYNIYQTENRKTGQRRAVFVDISTIAEFAEWKKARTGRPLAIPGKS